MGGAIQIYDAAPLLLLSVVTGRVVPSTVISFRVPTPDSRVTASVAIVVSVQQQLGLQQGFPFDITNGAAFSYALWLAGRDQDEGGSGLYVPTVNLLGTRAAPVAVPTDINIMGYSDDFDGGQDEIYGEFTVAGSWFANPLAARLYVRYQPSACEICDDEWREIVEQCNPQVPQSLVVT